MQITVRWTRLGLEMTAKPQCNLCLCGQRHLNRVGNVGTSRVEPTGAGVQLVATTVPGVGGFGWREAPVGIRRGGGGEGGVKRRTRPLGLNLIRMCPSCC